MIKKIGDVKKIENFRRKILGWFRLHKRALPWRDQITPYRVWISEIMLQQTQTRTVLPYYERFLKRFPDVQSLAGAPEEEVLRFWSGLGYYSRARNIHRAAAQILQQHGSFPTEFSEVIALPGIGRYTAGAICSIAFNKPYPVVDGNIRRVLTRLNGITGHTAETYFWNVMSAWVPQSDPSSFNQGMMELGALVCPPRNPKCSDCPVNRFCKAKNLRIQESISISRKHPNGRKLEIVFLVLERKGKVLVSAAGERDLIPGKWRIPWLPLDDAKGAEEAALSICRNITGRAARVEHCGRVRHSITHHQITGLVFRGEIKGPERAARKHLNEDSLWADRDSLRNLLTSSIYRKVLECVAIRSAA